MMKEDIYKYTDMNKYIENEIKSQKEHNETLYNKNQNLIQENETLARQLEQDEQELSTLLQENEAKHKIFDENQLNLELKNEKVNNDYEELIAINIKTKNDLELLCINYDELNNKNNNINNEIELIKELKNKQFSEIEDKIGSIISEIEKQVDNSSFYYIIIGNEAGKTISYLIKSGLNKVMLGHLSKESNFPELAYKTVMEELISSKQADNNISISVASRHKPSPLLDLKVV